MIGSRPLTDPEVQAVIAAFKGPTATRDRALFVLGLKTGFRISELLSLRRVDAAPWGQIVDAVTVKRQNMKGQTESRTVVLHRDAKKALAAWLEALASRWPDASPETYLFRPWRGPNKPITRVMAWRILTLTFRRLHLTGKLGTHCMRKSFAKRVHEGYKRDLIKTQKALGHKSPGSTASYLSFDQQEIDDVILES